MHSGYSVSLARVRSECVSLPDELGIIEDNHNGFFI